MSGGYSVTVSGALEASGTTVDSFAVINSSTGSNQNLIFDAPQFVAGQPIPTVSEWGGMILALMLFTAGARFLSRREQSVANAGET
jgi:hypothetical protein